MAAMTIHLAGDVISAIAKWAPMEHMSAEEFILSAVSEKCAKAHALEEAEHFWQQLAAPLPLSLGT
ncbi:MAG: hypothetical protein K0R43_3681 [Pseudoduganella sp.]|jgi:hypothetical protein|nr:hypothetical protein [Pseudoduganella sp.]